MPGALGALYREGLGEHLLRDRRLKDYFDVIGMILFSIDVVMAPFGLAWEDVGARFSNVVSLISVGYWSLGGSSVSSGPTNETVYHIRLSGDQLALRAALIHIGHV